jgi:fumarate reductase subunit C
MSARARVDAMKPSAPPLTRTADPRPPDHFPTRGNYLGYVAFGATGVLMWLGAFGVLRALRALGAGEEAWNAMQADLQHPLYIVFHAFLFVGLTWFALRFFRVFPKTQPPKMGPFPRPSDAFFAVALNGAFVVVTLAIALILGGAIL